MIGVVVGIVIGGLVGALGASRDWSLPGVIMVAGFLSASLTFVVLWLAKVLA